MYIFTRARLEWFETQIKLLLIIITIIIIIIIIIIMTELIRDEKEDSDWFPERSEFCNMDR